MSGGEFDYFYSRMNDIAVQIDPCETGEERIVAKLMKDFATLMYELEWYRSGDTGQEDFIKAFNKFSKKWLKEKKK